MSNRTDTEAVIKLVINGQQAMSSLKELTDTHRKLNSELRNMKVSDPGYAKVEKELQMVSRATSELRKQQQGLNNDTDKFKLSWKGIAAGIVSAGVITKGFDLIADGIIRMKDAYAEAEKNRAVLTNAFMGDAKQANDALKMLMDFAAKTPFGLQEATGAFLKMVNRGITPTREEMVKLGDVAASQGKSMDQYVEAILDAQSGENERLKELGIRAQKNGDMVSFSFKGITKEVKATDEAIYEALLSFGEMEGVVGTMEVVSKTIVGLQSNISDSWDQIFTKLGQSSSGFLTGFYQKYSDVLGWISDDLLSTESNAQKLTKEFNNQAAEVSNLEKNVNPLLDRYDQLKEKGKLNKEEQGELKKIIQQVTGVLPSAGSAFNDYGEAMELNTDKARKFIKIQQLLLQQKNQDAIAKEKQELKEKEYHHLSLKRMLETQTATVSNSSSTGSMGALATSSTVKLTDKDLKRIQGEVKKVNDEIEDGKLRLEGLTGDYLAIDEGAVKKPEVKNTARTTKTKPTSGETEAEKDKKKAIAEFVKLNEIYEELGVDQLEIQLSKNQKEIALEAKKYDTLIQQKRDFMGMDGTNKVQKDATQTHIDQLESDKKTALTKLSIRQEEEMVQKISDLRGQLAKRHETELGKETILINKFYDQQEKDFLGNAPRLAQLKLEREKDLTDAQIREKERLEVEKEAIEAQYQGLTGNKDAMELAALHKKYDDQILALRERYSKERQLTEEFHAMMNAVNSNRDAATAAFTKEKEGEKSAQWKDAAIQSAQVVSDAVFTIAANNRQRETDIKLSALDKEREQELSQKNLSEKQKAAINKKFDEKEKEIKLKAWKADKSAAITQGVINGALAVTKALPNIPLAVASGIAAAAQIAVIVAQKPPEFSVGVRNFKGGPAIVGEDGPEAVEENGKLWLATKATLANLAPGANVYTVAETASMMGGSLGENLYQPASYSIDNNGAREAEKQYRSTSIGLPNYSSNVDLAENRREKDRDQEIVDVKKTLERFIETQSNINERPVNLYYNQLKDFSKNIEDSVKMQTG